MQRKFIFDIFLFVTSGGGAKESREAEVVEICIWQHKQLMNGF